jgi:hypothetical protein
MYDDPTPLHQDSDISQEWNDNELTWEDVYSKKPIEYLEAISRGETPRWDSDAGKYVYSNDIEETTSIGGNSKSINQVEDPQINDEADEELPF